MSEDSSTNRTPYALYVRCLEVAALVLVFAMVGGDAVPNVNEGHYLCKAKNFWDGSWAEGDLFLESASAHWFFYVVCGWPTLWLSLEATAWLLRVIGWLMLASSWVALSSGIYRTPGLSILTGGLFAVMSLRLQMSGEWVVGGFESKVVAYAFVFWALAALIRGRWKWAWPLLGVAAAFHVLVGGWAVVATAWTWVFAGRQRESMRGMVVPLLIGFAISLLGLAPAIALSVKADPKLVVQANMIYVYERLGHHLVYGTFSLRQCVLHQMGMATAIICGFVSIRRSAIWQIGSFANGAILLAWIGIAIDQWAATYGSEEQAAGILRYYWFRLSDAAVPLALAVSLPFIWQRLFNRHKEAMAWGIALGIAVIGIELAGRGRLILEQRPPAAVRQSLGWDQGDQEFKRQLYLDWKQTCGWIREQTTSGSLFLTPRSQQTFKWYAHRAEVVNWKDVPQDAATLIEWRARIDQFYGDPVLGYLNLPDEELDRLLERYAVDYLVINKREVEFRRRVGYPIPYQQVYPTENLDSQFYVFRR